MKRSVGLAISLILFRGVLAAEEGRDNVPPKGFTALFNGKNLDGWVGLGHTDPYKMAKWSDEERQANAKKADADMRRHWRAAGGEIINDGSGVYLTTAKSYRDFELLIDWRMMSPGTDSGIYLRQSPQVQIWDPKDPGGKANGADKGSGALWNNNPDAAGRFPPVVADAPVGEWNRFRILMVGERVSVWLNGKKTVDNAVMNNYWDRKRPIPPAGPIQLQTHGGEMRFRNVFIREIPPEEADQMLMADGAEGFVSVFNGKDLEGWVGDVNAYSVKDGVMVFTGGHGGGDIFLKDVYANFAIRYEYKVPPGGNNGLLIRVPNTQRGGSFTGMEIQILDDEDKQYAGLKPWQFCGSVYGLIPAQPGYTRRAGEWNFQEVVADGPQIKVYLNGTLITQGDLSKIDPPPDGRDHPGMKRTDGYVGFMGHGHPVEFRNIRIKRLGGS
ncbi:MAG: hypothetical protein AMXMBFR83_13510 [Phycisphaerae bacterium]